MKIGLHLSDFTFSNGPGRLADDLTCVVVAAEDAGFARVSVMDHVWQISVHGPPEHEMLEAYTTLGYIAARTSRVDLLTWVTAVTYREPGLLAKIISTLDVLSNGRAWLGIGAAWNEAEARGLGLSFPPLAERFERLEETLQICRQMWDPNDDGPFHGKHYQLERTLNVPQPLRRPRVLIGGGGERKTLRLVAKYADACNLFVGPELPHKLDVLRAHCAEAGRPYEAIEKTVTLRFSDGDDGHQPVDPSAALQQLAELAELGIDQAIVVPPEPLQLETLDLFGERIIPEALQIAVRGRESSPRPG